MDREECRLDEIFQQQRQLMRKYAEIEASNGFGYELPLDLHNPHDQAVIREHFGRITEELVEVIDAYSQVITSPYPQSGMDEVLGEMADVYHFLIETFIISGLDPLWAVIKPTDKVPGETLDCKLKFVFHSPHVGGYQGQVLSPLAMSMVIFLYRAQHELKNKHWCRTQRETDIEKFHEYLREAHFAFISMCATLEFSHLDLYHAYMGKSKINRQRQDSGY